MELSANLALIAYSEAVDCLHSRRVSSELGLLRCVPASRARCQVDTLRESTGKLVVTADTRSRTTAELADIANYSPACKEESAIVGTLPAYQKTSDSQVATLVGASKLDSIPACSVLGNTNIAKLADRSTYNFLWSTRGAVAIQANAGGDQTCLTQLQINAAERAQLDQLKAGNLVLETSCYYGGNSVNLPYSLTRCNSNERGVAHRFDFASN